MTEDCQPVPAGGIALPVVAGPTRIRPSRMSRRRAAVLIGVHVLIAVHIAHWLATGSTFTPVEPSEAMELPKHGIINVGVVFFALAIASTLVLGRWFCGWGCHLVALQDLARWLLGKLHLRPRPVRSRLLVVVPLLAFLYMFVQPAVLRLLTGELGGGWETRWVTRDFWATFPSWLPATLTFVICGFVAIYFLGAKGFCTNACPYGGVFALADQLAPMRIRVTDACRGCGHCTAVCSSNVRVHDEVRTFGMVVDPGCMKCLDCVSVCPNDALYVGWGAPAIFASRRVPPAAPGSAGAPRHAAMLRWGLTAAFCLAAFLIFAGHDRAFLLRPVDWIVAAIMSALALGLMLMLRPKSRWPRPATLADDAVLGIAFLIFMLLLRGLHGMVAFLFALGASAVAAYLCLQGVHLLTRADLAMHGWLLKRGGRLAPAGAVLLAGLAGLGALGAYAGVAQVRTTLARWELYEIEQLEAQLVGQPPNEEQSEALIRRYQAYLALQPEGLHAALNLGRLLMQLRRFDEAEQVYARAREHHPGSAELLTNTAALHAARGRIDEAILLLQEAVKADPKLPQARVNLAALYGVQQRWRQAAEQFEALAALRPDEPDIPARAALCYAELGEYDTALRWLDRAESLAGGKAHILSAIANMRAHVEQRRSGPPAPP